MAKLKKYISAKGVLSSFLYSCLYLVGWCFSKNIPSFFSNPYRTGFFIASAVLYYTAHISFYNMGMNFYKKGMPERTKEDLVMLGVTIIQITLCVISPYCDAAGVFKFPDLIFIRILGATVFVLSSIIIVISFYNLGSNFSIYVTVLDDHKLVKTGLYSIIRHPWYMGVIMGIVCIPLIFLSYIGLIISLLCIPLILWRIKREESLLKNNFGQDWDNYAAKTKKLIPFVF